MAPIYSPLNSVSELHDAAQSPSRGNGADGARGRTSRPAATQGCALGGRLPTYRDALLPLSSPSARPIPLTAPDGRRKDLIDIFSPAASYIKPCRRDDPNLNECALKNGREAVSRFVNGKLSCVLEFFSCGLCILYQKVLGNHGPS